MRPVTLIALAAAVIVWCSAPALSQSAPWREVDNPYQEDIEYDLGETFSPRVDIDGIRWDSLVIEIPDGELIAAEQDVTVEVTVDVENRTASAEKVLIILLLEDADGGPLDRIELRSFKIGSERRKERRETARIASEHLRATERVYLFFEILE
jgi:hypothetical protein